MTWKKSRLLSKAFEREVHFRQELLHDIVDQVLLKEKQVDSHDVPRKIVYVDDVTLKERLEQADNNLQGEVLGFE